MTRCNGFLTDERARVSPLELAETLYKIPTLLTTYTRCGKPNCRCRRGQLHGPYHALHWRDGLTQRRVYVRRTDVERVSAALARRRAERALERLIVAEDLALLSRLDRLRQELKASLVSDGELR